MHGAEHARRPSLREISREEAKKKEEDVGNLSSEEWVLAGEGLERRKEEEMSKEGTRRGKAVR